MSEGVVVLRSAELEASAEVVEKLEYALELARSGQLRNVMLCGFCAGGDMLTLYTSSDDRWRDMVALRRLEHRLQVSVDGGADA